MVSDFIEHSHCFKGTATIDAKNSCLIIMLILLPISLSYANLSDGLVLYLHFDEGSVKVACDSSGRGQDGIVNGTTWTEGRFGKALKFR